MYMQKDTSKAKPVIVGLLLSIIMSAMDNTIVSTSMGTIISQIGGMEKFIWVSSAYLIASLAGMPIYGKLSDMYGRKMFFLFGLSLFITGSVLCGFSQTMNQLIILRVVQGLGGGAVMPIAFTIIYDIIPIYQRGKISALFGTAFGISSIFGPLLGAFLSDFISWRWIFYVNIPLGIISAILIFMFYHESLNRTKQKIDYAGAFVIVTGIVCLMLALELGGKTFEWLSFAIIGLFAAALMLLSAFILIEFKAAEPIIPMSLFKSRLFTSSQGVGFFYGFVMITASVYIPIFIQGVNGGTATNSGLILLPMTIGSVAGSQFGGLFSQKASYRRMMLYSIAIALSGFILLSTLTPATAGWLISVFMLISGFGLGISYSILSMSAIHDIDIRQRGTANSCSSFFRTFGMTLGVTICGTVQNNFMQKRFLENIPQYSTFNTPIEARALLQPQVRMNIPKDILSKMTDILASSITSVFLLCLIPLAISLVLILLMGKSRLDMSGKSKSTPQTDIKSSQATD